VSDSEVVTGLQELSEYDLIEVIAERCAESVALKRRLERFYPVRSGIPMGSARAVTSGGRRVVAAAKHHTLRLNFNRSGQAGDGFFQLPQAAVQTGDRQWVLAI
jgi:hypothetical protein